MQPAPASESPLERARALGWGPESALEPVRVAALERFALGPRVLDVGCATGLYVDFLAGRGLEAIGLEGERVFLDAGRRLGRRGRFVEGSALALPFRGASFATVVLYGVLEHLDDRAGLAEAARVATRRIIALVPQTEPEPLAGSGLVLHHRLDRTHLRAYTVAECRALFAAVSWRVIHAELVHPVALEKLFFLSLASGRRRRVLLRRLLKLLGISFKQYHDEILVVAEPSNSKS